MHIETRKEGTATVVTVAGRMDAVTAPEYQKRLDSLVEEGNTRIVADFGQLDYISSAGLRSLLTTAKRIKAANGSIRLANVHGAVREVFDISGFASLFPMHGSVTDALASDAS
jgi:stage II sporulation protein AA (anti-sigma F factor antagonist)